MSSGGARPSVMVLCADDYAMTEGVSEGIDRLASAGCLSAASALVTAPHWPGHAGRLASQRGRIATGLHLDLTLGRPLTPLSIAPAGVPPKIDALVKASLSAKLDGEEIEAEIAAQIDAFADATGFAPDFIDGHQHVHALPVVRDALIAVLARKFPPGTLRPLVRNPTSPLLDIARRRRAAAKAITVAWLARGFGAHLRRAGLPSNDTFAGFSTFDADGVAADFASYAIAAGPLHVVMCHPGLVDDELTRIDPVTARRRAELEFLLAAAPAMGLWRPARSPGGDPIDWAQLREAAA
jgi:predicted glycoside hydrolase/deacetylase ChbG (UPF0249 family)